MKTLFWTGSACASPRHGQARVWRWWYYYQPHQAALGVTHWAVFNNGDTHLPVEAWATRHDASLPLPELCEKKLHVIYHAPELKRADVHNYDGFWRNLQSALRVCAEQAFDRFIQIEGDAYILNPNLFIEIGGTTSGLVTYWSPGHNIPESAIVICSADHFKRLAEVVDAIRAKSGGCTAADRFEVAAPWTDIRKDRKGDRYPEFGPSVPADAQYCTQLVPWAIIQPDGRIDSAL